MMKFTATAALVVAYSSALNLQTPQRLEDCEGLTNTWEYEGCSGLYWQHCKVKNDPEWRGYIYTDLKVGWFVSWDEYKELKFPFDKCYDENCYEDWKWDECFAMNWTRNLCSADYGWWYSMTDDLADAQWVTHERYQEWKQAKPCCKDDWHEW